MYPSAPGVCLIVAVTPSFLGAPTILSLFGHWTVVPEPTCLANSPLIAERCLVKTKLVPLASERRTTVMGRSGSLMFGLAAAIRGSLQRATLPRKISGYTSRGSLRPAGLPGRL